MSRESVKIKGKEVGRKVPRLQLLKKGLPYYGSLPEGLLAVVLHSKSLFDRQGVNQRRVVANESW